MHIFKDKQSGKQYAVLDRVDDVAFAYTVLCTKVLQEATNLTLTLYIVEEKVIGIPFPPLEYIGMFPVQFGDA